MSASRPQSAGIDIGSADGRTVACACRRTRNAALTRRSESLEDSPPSAPRRDEPCPPVAVAIGLPAHELNPRERARIVDGVARGVDAPLDGAYELVVEREVQLGLVAQEPSRDPLGDRTWRLVSGTLGPNF
jgi:hypothetical protein